tara:strand:+ start:7252 stop:8340 length:1089 start_codon:yes stop_codon:yes gene_type:complete
MELEKLIEGNVDLNGYIMMFPIIIIVYIITSSFIMQDICGMIYIFGITLTLLNVYAVSSISNNSKERIKNYTRGSWDRSGFCYIGLPFINKFYNNASPNAAIIVFTLFFFLMGDIANNIREMKNPFGFGYYLASNKPWLLTFFSIMFVLNIFAERLYNCNYRSEFDYFVGGGAIGLLSGILIMVFFLGAGLKNSLKTSSFLQVSETCVTPLKKIFQCDKISADDNKVYFLKLNEDENSNYIDSLKPGDLDTYNISTLKNYGNYEKIIMTGETMVYFYEKENRKGKVIIIDKYGNVKGKGKFVKDDTKYDTVVRSTEFDGKAAGDKTKRSISWDVIVDKFKTDWPEIKGGFVGPQSILIHKEY